MSVKVNKAYHNLKNNTKKLEELYNCVLREYLPQFNIGSFTKSCRVIVLVDVCDWYSGEQNDSNVVLSGIYIKDGGTIIYEGAYECVVYYTYQYQGEDSSDLLYKNLIQRVYNKAKDGSCYKKKSYYTEGAIDVLRVFNIYQGERYLYSVGVGMNLQVLDDGVTLSCDEGWRVLTENNLLVLNVSEIIQSRTPTLAKI